MLIREIETMPEEAVQETLDFALFLRTRKETHFNIFPENKPNRFNAMRVKTRGFKFNREEANER